MQGKFTTQENAGNRSQHLLRWIRIFLTVIVLIAIFSSAPGIVQAQEEGTVQEFEGRIELGQGHIYMIPNLGAGQVLSVYARGVSGNLDPLVAIVPGDADIVALIEAFWEKVSEEAARGRDPLLVIDEVAGELFLAWDDDSGEGYDAALEYLNRVDGDYRLLVTTPPSNETFGDYQLQIGIDSPQVLEGIGRSSGDTIAYLDQEATGYRSAVQEVTGTLSLQNNTTFYNLVDIEGGTTFDAFVEPTSGNLIPTLVLKDFGGKPVRSGNISGDKSVATLQHYFDEGGTNYILEVSNCKSCEEENSGDFRLLVGNNAQDVQSGEAESFGNSVLRLPIEVAIGVQIDQITGVDQKAENFGVVANLIMSWTDPDYAFSPDNCNCNAKTFTGNRFNSFVTEVEGRWPEFSIINQQGNRWVQNQIVAIKPDGHTGYVERFSTTLQAPDFNFRHFPFDSQDFYLRILSVFPEEFYVFIDSGNTRFGDQLGEEEWVITEHETIVDKDSSEGSRSRYSLHFQAERNLTFYIVRFLIPLGLIITVSWITFFLRDYTRRIEITTGNLLLYIAWSFSISDNLPRLGYLTFMDAIMMTTFFISVIVVVFNVVLKRMEVTGKESVAFKFDKYTLWIYPLIQALLFGSIVYVFFVLDPFA